MKKLIFLCFFCLFISGCGNKEIYPLSEKYYQGDSLITIDNHTLKDLENAKSSFAVFVYMPNCLTSASFREVVESFLAEEEISFYQISGTIIDDTKLNETLKYYPSVAIYQEGKIIAYLRADSNDDKSYYESVEGFREWFTKYISLNKEI